MKQRGKRRCHFQGTVKRMRLLTSCHHPFPWELLKKNTCGNQVLESWGKAMVLNLSQKKRMKYNFVAKASG
ncbi:hypothetical protein Bca52824_001125 [Brassica carinata]|uniref:Uncharacterized protein n=1 Tax=Brassica carinata TaxID=52824 RepID=A0A8X7WIS6_BRACI|nr:hypothetical protein Bca52824_001125 [Brassica carinata]